MWTTFATTDLDLASAALSQGYGSVRLLSADQHTYLGVVQHELGRARLDQIRYRMGFEASAPPMGFFPVCRVTEGAVTYHRRGGDQLYRAGDVFLCAHPDEPALATVRDLVGVEIAALQPSLLIEVAQEARGGAGGVRLLDHAPVTAAAGRRWWQTYDAVRAAVDHPAAPQAERLFVGQAARFLAAVALVTFPTTAVVDPDASDRRDAHPATLRRAVSFIEAHPDRDLSPADIAEAAGVTIRALQLTFRRHLDTTPLSYVRRTRLAAARDELLVADPDRTTVAAVAGRWGFHNLGRFAEAYRLRFGELPSQTLHR